MDDTNIPPELKGKAILLLPVDRIPDDIWEQAHRGTRAKRAVARNVKHIGDLLFLTVSDKKIYGEDGQWENISSETISELKRVIGLLGLKLGHLAMVKTDGSLEDLKRIFEIPDDAPVPTFLEGEKEPVFYSLALEARGLTNKRSIAMPNKKFEDEIHIELELEPIYTTAIAEEPKHLTKGDLDDAGKRAKDVALQMVAERLKEDFRSAAEIQELIALHAPNAEVEVYHYGGKSKKSSTLRITIKNLSPYFGAALKHHEGFEEEISDKCQEVVINTLKAALVAKLG